MARAREKNAARAIWSGSISFGLVSVPVRMLSAIDEKDVHFHLLHRKDDSRIGYEKICKREQKPVPESEIGTAFEVSKDEYVYLEDADFEAAAPKGYHAFELSDFVALDEIDPIYLERSYYLAPAAGGEKVYAVLAKAMDRAGLAAIGTYVMRNKQHLGCLRVRDGVLTLSKLYFADEIRPHQGLAPSGVRVAKAELDLAGELIDRYTSTFDIGKYEDTYRDALLGVIKAKQKGNDIHVDTADDGGRRDSAGPARGAARKRGPPHALRKELVTQQRKGSRRREERRQERQDTPRRRPHKIRARAGSQATTGQGLFRHEQGRARHRAHLTTFRSRPFAAMDRVSSFVSDARSVGKRLVHSSSMERTRPVAAHSRIQRESTPSIRPSVAGAKGSRPDLTLGEAGGIVGRYGDRRLLLLGGYVSRSADERRYAWAAFAESDLGLSGPCCWCAHRLFCGCAHARRSASGGAMDCA